MHKESLDCTPTTMGVVWSQSTDGKKQTNTNIINETISTIYPNSCDLDLRGERVVIFVKLKCGRGERVVILVKLKCGTDVFLICDNYVETNSVAHNSYFISAFLINYNFYDHTHI